jgi:hypothetical protein
MVIPTIITTALTGVGAALGRNLLGWVENAAKDGKIDNYEWSQLAATVVRVTTITVGINLGFGLDGLASAGSAIVADFVLAALKKKK